MDKREFHILMSNVRRYQEEEEKKHCEKWNIQRTHYPFMELQLRALFTITKRYIDDDSILELVENELEDIKNFPREITKNVIDYSNKIDLEIKTKRAKREAEEKKERELQTKYQSIWTQIKQNYQSDLLNELLQIYYPEYQDMIARGQAIDFIKAILKGQDLDKIQDFEFFFADKIQLPQNDKKRHTFIVASNGSGKSELIKYLIWQEFKNDKIGLILIDPHGDLAKQVAKLKAKNNEKLVYISTSLSPEYTPRFNPFDVDNHDHLEVERNAKDMVLALGEIVDTSFSEYMQRVLFPCIYLLMMEGNKSISDLVDMMRDSEIERIKRIAKTLPNERVRAFFEYDFSSKQFESTKHSINSKLGNLIDETPFRELTQGKNTIDLKKYINEGYKVVFDLSGLSKDAKNAFGKMIVAQLHFLAHNRENSTHRPSVYIYIDEFQRFVSNTINEGLAELRKYGFHFVLATQNLTQLDTTTANNVLSNTNVKIVGQNDPLTNKKMSVQIDVDSYCLSTLKVGQFYLKSRSSDEAQYIEVPDDLVETKGNVEATKWEQIKAEQLKKYYQLRFTNSTSTAEPSEPQQKQTTDSQNDPLKEFSKPNSIKPSEMEI